MKPHGNVGRRNAAKSEPKTGRIAFRCLPAVEDRAKMLAQARGVSVAVLLTDLVNEEFSLHIDSVQKTPHNI